MEQIIGLDIGETRVGIAKSDSMGIIVKPYKTININQLIEEIKALQEIYDIQTIVVGLPRNMDGSIGEQAQKVEKHVDKIKTNINNVEIVYEDERLTSVEAKKILKEKGIHIKQNNKDLIDMYAAAIILEQYIKKTK